MSLRRGAFLVADGALLVGIVLVAVWIVRSPLYLLHPEWIGTAVAVDLTLTAALVHLFAGQLGARLPAWTTLSVVGGGAIAAHLLVPSGAAVGVVLGLVELAVLGVVGLGVWRAVRMGRRRVDNGVHGWSAVEQSLAEILGSRGLASALVMELRLVVLALTGPLRRTPGGDSVVAMHRESGWMWVAAALVGLSFVEVPALHLFLDWMLERWADWTAVALVPWLVTLASAYGALWLVGDAQALRLHPTRVERGVLHLAVGLRWQADIPLADIVQVEPVHDADEVDVSVFGAPNVRLVLRREVVLCGPFGIRRSARSFTLQVDDVQGFVALLGGPGATA